MTALCLRSIGVSSDHHPRLQRCRLLAWLSLCLVFLLPPVAAQAQFILPGDREVRWPQSVGLSELAVDATVKEQIAQVQVSQVISNPSDSPVEAQFLFPLPEDVGVENFVLIADGKEIAGQLLDKDQARAVYEQIVRRRRDPALLEFAGRGLFRSSVFPIAARGQCRLTLRYSQVCRSEGEMLALVYPLGMQCGPVTSVTKLNIRVAVQSKRPIQNLYSPTHALVVQRADANHLVATCQLDNARLAGEFRLYYSLTPGEFFASMLSYRPAGDEDGFFLLLASPPIVTAKQDKPLAKDVLFVLDRSGSMAGKKIEQARAALRFVLNNLRPGDRFNIITYDDRVTTFRDKLQDYDDETRKQALAFVDDIREGGSTNIDLALGTALGQFPPDQERPQYLLFLTDGLPTAGERNELAIAANAGKLNKSKVRIFTFGVGFDVNSRLLERLHSATGGNGELIRPDEDLEAVVARFYSKLTAPVLTDLRIELAGSQINRPAPRDLSDLFAGSQLLWLGRYSKSGKTTITLRGRVAGREQRYSFPAELAAADPGDDNSFIARLWATRRIGQLLDEIDLHGQNKELLDELLALSKRYGILTPYTSFLAQEEVQLQLSDANLQRARRELDTLQSGGGAGGFAARKQRNDFKSSQQAAPAATAAPTSASERFAGAQEPRATKLSYEEIWGDWVQVEANAAGGKPAGSGVPQPEAGEVRWIGDKAFFFKGGIWLESELTEKDIAAAKTIHQLSDEYFALARDGKSGFAQYLTFRQPVIVRLGNTVYRIEPAAGEPQK